uniref:Uncharacterized protein n=1 Tax=Anguilla anguilla TaxID=7936 RepID=A0A0E9WYH6_ANGAN
MICMALCMYSVPFLKCDWDKIWQHFQSQCPNKISFVLHVQKVNLTNTAGLQQEVFYIKHAYSF